MFFQFFYFAIGLQLIIFLISGLYNILTNLSVDDCKSGKFVIIGNICNPTWWVRMSLVNKLSSEIFENGQDITNLISVILCVLFLQICRYLQRKEAFECDKKVISATDYSIVVENLPQNCKISEIRLFFETCLENTNFNNQEGF